MHHSLQLQNDIQKKIKPFDGEGGIEESGVFVEDCEGGPRGAGWEEFLGGGTLTGFSVNVVGGALGASVESRENKKIKVIFGVIQNILNQH